MNSKSEKKLKLVRRKQTRMGDKTTFALRANGLFQDGKAHFAARFPPAQAAAMSQTWTYPITASRESKCPVNSVELSDVPMHLREKFIEKLIEKRHYHSLTIGNE